MLVLNLLLIGLAISLEPIPLTAFILILSSKGGVRKGAAFIFGWLLSLAIVIAFTVLVTGNKPPKPSTAPSLAALAARRQYVRLGRSMPVWRDGHVAWIAPTELDTGDIEPRRRSE